MDARDLLAGLKAVDQDRYLSVLYAPQDKRGDLATLYAFNAEIAAVRDRVREPLPGEIRLQWWRDVLEGNTPSGGHPLADALLGAIKTSNLPVSAFTNMLDARIFDLYNDPMPSQNDLEGYCGETASALIHLAALILDGNAAPDFAELSGHAGCAQAITGLIRLMPIHRSRGQCYVPAEMLAAVGCSVDELVAGEGAASGAVQAMAALARQHLAAFEAGAQAMPQHLRPAFLPLALTDAYLDIIERSPEDALKQGVELNAARRHFRLLRRAMRGW